jgi:hypothetical protein
VIALPSPAELASLADAPICVLRRHEDFSVVVGASTALPWDYEVTDTHDGFSHKRPATYDSRKPGIYQAVCTVLLPGDFRGLARLEILGCHVDGREIPWGVAEIWCAGMGQDECGPVEDERSAQARRHVLSAAGVTPAARGDWAYCGARIRLAADQPGDVVLPGARDCEMALAYVTA